MGFSQTAPGVDFQIAGLQGTGAFAQCIKIMRRQLAIPFIERQKAAIAQRQCVIERVLQGFQHHHRLLQHIARRAELAQHAQRFATGQQYHAHAAGPVAALRQLQGVLLPGQAGFVFVQIRIRDPDRQPAHDGAPNQANPCALLAGLLVMHDGARVIAAMKMRIAPEFLQTGLQRRGRQAALCIGLRHILRPIGAAKMRLDHCHACRPHADCAPHQRQLRAQIVTGLLRQRMHPVPAGIAPAVVGMFMCGKGQQVQRIATGLRQLLQTGIRIGIGIGIGGADIRPCHWRQRVIRSVVHAASSIRQRWQANAGFGCHLQ